MAIAPSTGEAAVDRPVPDLSTVFREEMLMVSQRLTQGRPWVVGIGWLLLFAFFFADSPRGPLLFVLLGLAIGTGPWGNRLVGRSVGWELPVQRSVLNRLRIVSGLIGVSVVVALSTPLVMYFGEGAWAAGPSAVLAAGAGAGMMGFTAGFALGQVAGRQHSAPFIIGMMLLFPLALLPSRFILWFLPEAAHGAITGRHGLNTFIGRSLVEGPTAGVAANSWSVQSWGVSAFIWGTICIGLLFVLSNTHQE